jgi:hypothetical protein
MLITNVPADLLTVSEVIVLQRARWQIERFFRLWKDGGKIDEWQGRTPWRMLCEIYAKVMTMLMQHWLLVLGTWHDLLPKFGQSGQTGQATCLGAPFRFGWRVQLATRHCSSQARDASLSPASPFETSKPSSITFGGLRLVLN